MYKTVTINAKQYPVRVGYSALIAVKEKHGKSFESMGSEDLNMFESMLWQALKSGHVMRQEEFPADELKESEVPYYLDECLIEFKEVVQDFFLKLTETQQAPPEAKKKTVGKK